MPARIAPTTLPVIATKRVRTPRSSDTDTDPDSDYDGYRWQDVVKRVCGFRIKRAGSLSIMNLCARALAHDKVSSPAGGDHFRFALLPDEYIACVDVFGSTHEITAIRFHTDKRVSQWYGKPSGTFSRTVEADDGYCINAIQSRYAATECTELRFVELPLAVVKSEYSTARASSELIEKGAFVMGNDLRSFTFCSYSLPPRAIVVTAKDRIFSMEVLSGPEFDRYTTLFGLWEESAWSIHHWVVLGEDERIEAVGVATNGGSLEAICFKTNLTTSHWIGGCVPKTATWLDCHDRPGAYICGFQIRQDFTINGLGVIYSRSTPATDAQPSKAA